MGINISCFDLDDTEHIMGKSSPQKHVVDQFQVFNIRCDSKHSPNPFEDNDNEDYADGTMGCEYLSFI